MPCTCARWHANVPVPADSSNDEADETSDGTASDDHCREHKFIEVTENNNNTTLFVMNTYMYDVCLVITTSEKVMC